MPRIFYTEDDIEDMARRGVKEIELNENIYLTDLAAEKMEKLGMKTKVAPSGSTSPQSSFGTGGSLTDHEREQVIEKVRSGVIARLGPGVDTNVVDVIVRRVVNRL